MSAAVAVTEGRVAAEALMVDTCTVSAPDTAGAFNEATGQYEPTAGAQKYAGKCRVRPPNVQDRTVEAGDRVVSLRSYVVSLPLTATVFAVDDVVRITASVLDPALVGARLRVTDVAKGTHLTARRLVCEEAA
jgi:hypothetical protein